jgi:[ribosomal protein S5]-alanine N-acetyltransferase
MAVVIETERLVLRPWKIEDAEALLKYASDRRVADAGLWPVHKSIEDSLMVLEKMFIPCPMIYAIVLKETGEPVGSIGLVPIGKENYKASASDREVGYWIGYAYWGRGLMTEALKAFVGCCKEDGTIESLVITTTQTNAGSQGVAEKCGFEKVGDCCCDDVPSFAYRMVLW